MAQNEEELIQIYCQEGHLIPENLEQSLKKGVNELVKDKLINILDSALEDGDIDRRSYNDFLELEATLIQEKVKEIH